MQFARIWCIKFAIALSLSAVSHPQKEWLTAEEIMREVAKRTQLQDAELKSYSVQRLYTIKNSHLESNPVMEVMMSYDSKNGKHAQILRSEHLTAIPRRVLLNLLTEEEKASKVRPSKAEINATHYRFTLIGTEMRKGKKCFRVRLSPTEQDKFLLNGEAWVDAQDFAIVHLEGQSSHPVSFWVGRPEVKQDFQKYGQFWMPAETESTVNVRFVGMAHLEIKCFDYNFVKIDWK